MNRQISNRGGKRRPGAWRWRFCAIGACVPVLALALSIGTARAFDVGAAGKLIAKLLGRPVAGKKAVPGPPAPVYAGRPAGATNPMVRRPVGPVSPGAGSPAAKAPSGGNPPAGVSGAKPAGSEATGPTVPGSGSSAAAGGTAATADGAASPDTAGNAVLSEILLSPEPYHYESEGRRDPFVSLIDDEAASEGQPHATTEYFVRGILWGDHDRFALVETSDGVDLLLREGDRFGPYSVTRIEPDAIEAFTSESGVGKTVRWPLLEAKGNKDGRGER